MKFLGAPDLVFRDLAKTYAAKLAFFNVFGHGVHSLLQRYIWILPGRFEEIEEFLAVQDFETLIDASPNVLLAVIRSHLGG